MHYFPQILIVHVKKEVPQAASHGRGKIKIKIEQKASPSQTEYYLRVGFSPYAD